MNHDNNKYHEIERLWEILDEEDPVSHDVNAESYHVKELSTSLTDIHLYDLKGTVDSLENFYRNENREHELEIELCEG